jgi:hypothetical protein
MSLQDERDDADERLRAAFQARRTAATTPEGCPAAADLWSAVRGELPLERRRTLVDHTSACGACAEAWRLAMDLSRELPSASRPWHKSFAPLAAAAVLVLALAGGVWLFWAPRPVEAPGFRGGEAPVIRSLLREDAALPRSDFRLRWSPGPDGSRYDVRVTTESLQVLAGGQRLAEPSFLVPESALAPLPKDSRILWRVEAVLPGGERAASATFVTRLE